MPTPDLAVFGKEADDESLEAGRVFTVPGSLVLNEGRPTVRLTVCNLSDRPIQVSLRLACDC